MGHGASRPYQVIMASGATLTAELDLGRGFARVYLDPTGAASEVRIQAAASTGGTYRQVYKPDNLATSTVNANVFKVASSVSGGMIEIPPGFQYMKIETTAAVANGVTFKLICSDS